MSATRTPEQKAAHAARMRAARAAKKAATGEQPAPTGGTTVTVDVPTDPTGGSILAEPIITDRNAGMTLAELKTKYGLPGDRIREILDTAPTPTPPAKQTTPKARAPRGSVGTVALSVDPITCTGPCGESKKATSFPTRATKTGKVRETRCRACRDAARTA